MLSLIIIGGSAAGTAAAIYAARRKLDFLVLSEDFGGEVAKSGEIMNYPGIPQTDGIELTEKFREQLTLNGVQPEIGVRVQYIQKAPQGHFIISATKGEKEIEYTAKTVIVATGVHPRMLDVPGEKEFRGKGVTYCTTCDGPLFKGKKVVTVGGGSGALESALMLAEIADHVTIVNLNDAFRGEQVLIDKALEHQKIDVVYSAQTVRIEGEAFVNKLVYKHTQTNEEGSIDTQGIFVHIGMIPNSAMLPSDIRKNEYGEVEISLKGETSIPGLFAAGDITALPYKQIAIATGQGVCASLSAIEYLNTQT